MVSLIGEQAVENPRPISKSSREGGMTPEDCGLIGRVCAGDPLAIRQVFDRYYRRVIGFVRRYVDDSDVEDVAQEVFFHVFRGLQGLNDISAFEKYLFRAAKNRCINWLRKKHRVRQVVQLLCYSVQVWNTEEQEPECVNSLERVLEQLPDETRTYVQKFYIEKHSRAEIAAMMKESPSTVYRKISLSRVALLQKAKELQVTVVFQGRHGLSIQDTKA